MASKTPKQRPSQKRDHKHKKEKNSQEIRLLLRLVYSSHLSQCTSPDASMQPENIVLRNPSRHSTKHSQLQLVAPAPRSLGLVADQPHSLPGKGPWGWGHWRGPHLAELGGHHEAQHGLHVDSCSRVAVRISPMFNLVEYGVEGKCCSPRGPYSWASPREKKSTNALAEEYTVKKPMGK